MVCITNELATTPPMQHMLQLVATGDLVLDEPGPERYLAGIARHTRTADVAIGHVEVPHTLRGAELEGDVPAHPADPEHLAALADAGFDVVTLAGNHVADRGAEGIEDTIEGLRTRGIATCGAGATLQQARSAAIVERAGWKVAVLSYNCVGPESCWATQTRAGCAYVRIATIDGSPVAPAAELVAVDAASLAAMQEDVAVARRDADLVVVALHKGIVHVPARLAAYERPVAHGAIDAGADLVISHHAHILRGIEMYRGRPIYHGLGNGVVVTRALSPEQDHPTRAAWARRRRELFGFEPLADYPLYPFHPDARNAMLADLTVAPGGRVSAGFRPCWVEPTGVPTVVGRDEKGEEVADYVTRISAQAGFDTRFDWIGDRVVCS